MSEVLGRTRAAPATRDRGAVDVSVEALFGVVVVIGVLLALVEATAYWHARNVFDDAAADGVRAAAAYDGSCAEGVAVARAAVERQAGAWAGEVRVDCEPGAVVTVTVRGRTPGLLGAGGALEAATRQTAPRER